MEENNENRVNSESYPVFEPYSQVSIDQIIKEASTISDPSSDLVSCKKGENYFLTPFQLIALNMVLAPREKDKETGEPSPPLKLQNIDGKYVPHLINSLFGRAAHINNSKSPDRSTLCNDIAQFCLDLIAKQVLKDGNNRTAIVSIQTMLLRQEYYLPKRPLIIDAIIRGIEKNVGKGKINSEAAVKALANFIHVNMVELKGIANDKLHIHKSTILKKAIEEAKNLPSLRDSAKVQLTVKHPDVDKTNFPEKYSTKIGSRQKHRMSGITQRIKTYQSHENLGSKMADGLAFPLPVDNFLRHDLKALLGCGVLNITQVKLFELFPIEYDQCVKNLRNETVQSLIQDGEMNIDIAMRLSAVQLSRLSDNNTYENVQDITKEIKGAISYENDLRNDLKDLLKIGLLDETSLRMFLLFPKESQQIIKNVCNRDMQKLIFDGVISVEFAMKLSEEQVNNVVKNPSYDSIREIAANVNNYATLSIATKKDEQSEKESVLDTSESTSPVLMKNK